MPSEIIQVAEAGKNLFLLTVEYEEGDAASGIGILVHTSVAEYAALEPTLSTNDTIRAMWVSPTGSFWLSSWEGHVWTSAKVRWPAASDPELDHKVPNKKRAWSVTTLPRTKGKRTLPTLGAIWGTSDTNVYVAGSAGEIYRWNGTAWLQVSGRTGEIMAFGGTSPDDIWAVGDEGTILHFDGSAWNPVVPAKSRDDELFLDVCPASAGKVYICSKDGRLLHGSPEKLAPIHDDEDMPLMRLAMFDNSLYLAAGTKGVAKLRGTKVSVVRDTFHAMSVAAGVGRLYFLDASTHKTFIVHDPADNKLPWARVQY